MFKKKLLSLVFLCCLSLIATENEFVTIEQITAGGTININGSEIQIQAEKKELFFMQVGDKHYSLPSDCDKYFEGYDLSTLRLMYSVKPSDKTLFVTASLFSYDGKKQLEISVHNSEMTVTEITNSDDKNSPENSRKELFSSQNSCLTIIKTEVGKEIEIELESNPTTGFTWIPLIKYKKDFLQLKSSNFQPPDKQIPGAPGREKFIFKAEKSGSVLLEMQYRRVWEKNNAPAKGMKYLIVIERAKTFNQQF